jgi:hypothetical protein
MLTFASETYELACPFRFHSDLGPPYSTPGFFGYRTVRYPPGSPQRVGRLHESGAARMHVPLCLCILRCHQSACLFTSLTRHCQAPAYSNTFGRYIELSAPSKVGIYLVLGKQIVVAVSLWQLDPLGFPTLFGRPVVTLYMPYYTVVAFVTLFLFSIQPKNHA